MEKILEKVQYILEQMEQIDEKGDKHIVLPQKGSEIVFREQEVCYIERKKRITRIYLENGEEYTALKLLEMEQYLDKKKFVRCHNSFIVNLDWVHVFSRSEFLLRNDEVIPISRSRYESVRQLFEKWSRT